MTRLAEKTILEVIGCPHLTLWQPDPPRTYWVFEYNDGERLEQKTIYIPRLSDWSLAQWASEGRKFVAEIENAGEWP